MRCRKGDKEIDVSEKAFRVVYSGQGYVKVNDVDEVPDEKKQVPEETKNLEDMTVAELKDFAKKKGVEGAASLTKADLLEVLKDVEPDD